MVNFAIRSDHWAWQVLQLFGWNGRGSSEEAWSIFLIGFLLGSVISVSVLLVVKFFTHWKKEHLFLSSERDSLPETLVSSSLDQEVIDLLNLRRRRRQRRAGDRRASS